jgi:hypothetical protein
MITKTEVDREFQKFEKILPEVSQWCERDGYNFDPWERPELDQSGFNVSSDVFQLTVFWPNAGSLADAGFHCNPSPKWISKAAESTPAATITQHGLAVEVNVTDADNLIISQIGTLVSLQQIVGHLVNRDRSSRSTNKMASSSKSYQKISDDALATIATDVGTAAREYRKGQDKCRTEALRIWEGKCAVTGCDVADVLDCAHIIPWKKSETRGVQANFILLRADMHRLFDRGLLVIDPDTLIVSFPENLNKFAGSERVHEKIKIPKALEPMAKDFRSLLRLRRE